MYTQCPACHTYFRITPEQLQAAGGKVRCGECRNVFLAPDFLTDTLPGTPADAALPDEPDYEQLLREPPAEPAAAAELPTTGESATRTESAAAEPAAPQPHAPAAPEDPLAIDLEELFGPGATAEAESAPPPEEMVASAEAPAPPSESYGEEDIEALLTHTADDGLEHAPQTFTLPWDEPVAAAATAGLDIDTAADAPANFAPPEETPPSDIRPRDGAPALSPLSALLAEEEAAPRRSTLAILAWTLASLLLLATLGLPYLYINRATLIHQAELRPLLEQLCEHVACNLPPRRDLAALTLLERDIRSHDRYQGALTISATLQNRAPYAQPYPAVEVVMRDLGGKVVAARRFLPKEYLAGPVPALLEPQATAQLTLDVVDPGAEAVGFEFTFH